MRRLRLAEQALRYADRTQLQPYVCRACLAQTPRQFSSSISPNAETAPFFQRMRDSLFGSKESRKAGELREEAQIRKLDAIAKRDKSAPLEKVMDKRTGEKYEVAEVVDSSTHEGYTPSKSWTGLETIGSVEWIQKRADQGEVYAGFIPSKKAQLDDKQLKEVLHRISAEVMTMSSESKDEDSWMELAIEDPDTKLAILKRAMQVSGKRIPDPIINNCNTLGDLWAALRTKDKAKKLVRTPQLRRTNKSISNVAVHSVRQTPIHKEKVIGRWKIIKNELELRDLPVTGSRLRGMKEGLRTD